MTAGRAVPAAVGKPMDVRDTAEPPLVVDIDGTLIRTDLLVESALTLLRSRPLDALRAPAWLAGGRARLKRELAARVPIDPAALPYDEAVLERLRRERAAGRRIWLASASDHGQVEAIAAHLGLFDGVFASGDGTNLKAGAKARALVEAFGDGGFDYIGNDRADVPVWRAARRALLVDAPEGATRALGDDAEVLVPRRRDALAWLRALRPHQWLKNLLVFVPILAAHAITPATVAAAAVAFVAFSLVASGVYVLNDLLDLPSDRAHPRKAARPLASGALPIVHGPALSAGLVVVGLLLAALVGPALVGVLALYLLATTAYSVYLKRKALLDVITLAGLYTARVLGGAAAAGLVVSQWLLAFSMFLFLALAIVKRHAELVDAVTNDQGDPRGRGYLAGDLPMLAALGAASGYIAVLVLALYTQTPQVQTLYAQPGWLWGVVALLLYWISRMLLVSHRGLMDDDPLVFAVRDRGSLVAGALAAALVIAAT